jgi:hypothetical protein
VSKLLFATALLVGGCTFSPWPPDGGEPHVHSRKPKAVKAAKDGEAATLMQAMGKPARRPLQRNALETTRLTKDASKLVRSLLFSVAKDEFKPTAELLTSTARFGLPDVRERNAMPILPHKEIFLDQLQAAAGRFGEKAAFQCPPVMPPLDAYVSTGAEVMWCFYTSDDGLDVLTFKLRNDQGRARIDYIGFFPRKPDKPFPAAEGWSPSVRPQSKLLASGAMRERVIEVDPSRGGAP